MGSPGGGCGAPYGVTIVVSPLLSLMRDQLLRLPRGLSGVALTGRASAGGVGGGAEDAAGALLALRERRAHILYLSPERLLSPSFARLLRTPGLLPPVALCAVDEAHVASEWGHNFRPAYLRLGAAIHGLLRPRALLALTATATPAVLAAVCATLGVPYISPPPPLPRAAAGAEEDDRQLWCGPSIWVGSSARPNLILTASWCGLKGEGAGESGGSGSGEVRDHDRNAALLALLKSCAARGVPGGVAPLPPTGRAAATAVALQGGAQPPCAIVYVSTQMDVEAVASFLSEQGLSAAPYHAGLGGAAKERAYARWLAGSVRVIVATVAFGMGIDHAGVRLVVHAGVPRSVEDYAQQVGRAGRDGEPAWAHALLDANREDARRLALLSAGDELHWRQVAGFLALLSAAAGRAAAVAGSASALGAVVALAVGQLRAVAERVGRGAGGSGGAAAAAVASLRPPPRAPLTAAAARAIVEGSARAAAAAGAPPPPPINVVLSYAALTRALNARQETVDTLAAQCEAAGALDLLPGRATHLDIVCHRGLSDVSGGQTGLAGSRVVAVAVALASVRARGGGGGGSSSGAVNPLWPSHALSLLLQPTGLTGGGRGSSGGGEGAGGRGGGAAAAVAVATAGARLFPLLKAT